MRSFDGKVAAITGAASGMGRSLAVALARRGCEVALSDVDEVGLAETVRLATAAGKPGLRVTKRRLDVADAEAMRAWAKDVASEHGRVNLVFNNAGVSYSATVEGADQAEFERIVDIDYWGVVHGTRAFLPYLRASGEGHVINTSSLFGLIAFPGQCAYNSAKFAVRGFTEALRIELEITGAPVSATCVHPGGIKTNIARASKMHPSMADLGVTDPELSRREFEKAFRVTADDAAEQILRGVQRNARRVLIGTDARLLDVFQRLLPGTYHGVLARITRRVLAKQRAAKT
ncbi:MAG: SDR family NAD(P)-dependent oxidoreductase [Labilithrix sp.]|nr:SDR family NAD(P)-dependent oxidoreductase [Labilithrix sp.]MCW5815257.1 SDR family NAD(P)-dependent oxidoreductase [Labilithrix sp.]